MNNEQIGLALTILGMAAGGAAISGTASANLCMRYERIA